MQEPIGANESNQNTEVIGKNIQIADVSNESIDDGVSNSSISLNLCDINLVNKLSFEPGSLIKLEIVSFNETKKSESRARRNSILDRSDIKKVLSSIQDSKEKEEVKEREQTINNLSPEIYQDL